MMLASLRSSADPAKRHMAIEPCPLPPAPGHAVCYSLCPVEKDPRAAEISLPMCSASAGRTLSPADGHLAGWLRQEQAQLMCLSRHAPTASRHSPASKPRVCLLGRHLVERRPLATRWPPPTSRRSCGSAAGAAGASSWCFLPLPLAAGTSAHSYGHWQHTGKAATAPCACV